MEKSLIEIKCPKCGSKDFDVYDVDFNIAQGIHWDLCYCDDCGAEFKIKYIAVEIEEYD